MRITGLLWDDTTSDEAMEAMMTAQETLVVYPIEDGDLCAVVRTEDPAEAVRAYIAHATIDQGWDEWTAEQRAYTEAHLRAGAARWWRWNPCHPSMCGEGGGHRGHLGDGKPGQRGAWRGVAVYR